MPNRQSCSGISGEDPQEVDRKGRSSVTCRLPCRLTILANEIPKLPDPSGALETRYLIQRFTESFVGREDPNLEDDLKKELAGILLWAITGWRRLYERGRFIEPASAEEVHEQVADLGSPVARFVRERCVLGPLYEIEKKLLYDDYCKWAKSTGREHVEGDSEFGRLLCAAHHTIKSTRPRQDRNRIHKYQGITVSAGDE